MKNVTIKGLAINISVSVWYFKYRGSNNNFKYISIYISKMNTTIKDKWIIWVHPN